MTHTPGPWVLNGYGIETTTGIYRTVGCAAGAVRPVDSAAKSEFEALANARLMAAAPYMLTMLETIALHCSSLDVDGIRELAREAIDAARGGAQ